MNSEIPVTLDAFPCGVEHLRYSLGACASADAQQAEGILTARGAASRLTSDVESVSRRAQAGLRATHCTRSAGARVSHEMRRRSEGFGPAWAPSQ
jgi:hypothetical protein